MLSISRKKLFLIEKWLEYYVVVEGVKGYDTKVMRKVVALRKRDKDDIAEEEAVLEMYKEALGM